MMPRTLIDGATKLQDVTSNERDYFHLEILHYICFRFKKRRSFFQCRPLPFNVHSLLKISQYMTTRKPDISAELL